MPTASAKSMAALRKRRRDAGLCIDCGADHASSSPRCAECNAANRERVKKHWLRQQAARKASKN